MKLTKEIKNVIFLSILNDLPTKIDYEEQIQKLVWSDSFLQLPIELQHAINKNKDVKNFLDVETQRIADCGCMYLRSYKHYNMSIECAKEVQRLHKLNDDQDIKIRSIKDNLWAIINSCTTTDGFMKSYPEFANYVPKKDQPIRSLPVIDLINEMKQTGWKQKQQ